MSATINRTRLFLHRQTKVLFCNSPLKSFNLEISQISEVEIGADMEVEDLLKIYDQEKIRFLTSFVGQRIKVYVSLADKKSRRVTFSLKPKHISVKDKEKTYGTHH